MEVVRGGTRFRLSISMPTPDGFGDLQPTEMVYILPAGSVLSTGSRTAVRA